MFILCMLKKKSIYKCMEFMNPTLGSRFYQMSATENLRIWNCTSFVTIFAHAKRDSIFLEALTCCVRNQDKYGHAVTFGQRWRAYVNADGALALRHCSSRCLALGQQCVFFFLPSSSSQRRRRRAGCGPLGGGFLRCTSQWDFFYWALLTFALAEVTSAFPDSAFISFLLVKLRIQTWY